MFLGQLKRKKLEEVESEKSKRSKLLEEQVDDKMETSISETGNLKGRGLTA
jgi:hypothetical protein